MKRDYPWYDLVEGRELSQGDIVTDCPVLIPDSKIADETRAQVAYYDVIILSQSCDLVHGKLDLVLVCPLWRMSEMEERSPFLRSRNGKEALRQGNMPGYHLLNACEEGMPGAGYLVVDFRNVYGVPFTFLSDLAEADGPRPRLLSPYREHLSQAFARFFMRVGLPTDIPRFG